MSRFILAIDQGTTGSTALVIDRNLSVITRADCDFKQHYPKPGWVEHDPREIITSIQNAIATAFKAAGISYKDIATIGITNQRETVVAWDCDTGTPLHNAIVWQCGRSTAICDRLKAQGLEAVVRDKTGLLINPYFSATKIMWLMENGIITSKNVDSTRVGTMDSFVVSYLTSGKSFVTDMTNASRTMLYNIHERKWDAQLCEKMNIPMTLLPTVQPSISDFGHTDPKITGGVSIPITGIAGDQQAALFGHLAMKPGAIKATFGTGAFVLQFVGDQTPKDIPGLLLTLGVNEDGHPAYVTEGAVFIAGALIQWLRDELRLFESSSDSEKLATSVSDHDGLYVIPAFTGLGAPYWKPNARGMIVGLDRGTNKSHITRASLESVAFQVKDLVTEMSKTSPIIHIAVDGGMTENRFLMQFLADVLNMPIEKPAMVEITALGAAMLAGLGIGYWKSMDEIRAIQRKTEIFSPSKDKNQVMALYDGWKKVIEKHYL